MVSERSAFGGVLTLESAFEDTAREMLTAHWDGAFGPGPNERASLKARVEVDIEAALTVWRSIKASFDPTKVLQAAAYSIKGNNTSIMFHR
jgi:hypothetical protein